MADLCSVAWAIAQAAAAAGTDLDQTSFIAALEDLDAIPLSGDRIGSFSPSKHFAAPTEVYDIEWQLDCACWRQIGGPHPTNEG